ncbi:Six-bladed beta-propeller, TolB-like protein [Metarhizium album ARSEF 1941]|uniref:Six-bladed beta-propeller, TolB-like protein n=1 Tax=Metarhizium album (strain ARSEF 1941) TaxID=1081103 RepID=A0A0B2WNM6_METAS|nr:Six-bladed beta-propeller, TolB-like protein [Metarhizium album ARSEF 1941]KHN95588.1 Six-bladed beta-propeller, TolB-like protein [Metarhizium album ARSEF 1941]
MLFSAVVVSACFSPVVLAKYPKIRTLGQLTNGTWLENIVVRSNGAILATQLLNESNIWTIKKPESCYSSLELVTSLPFANASVGITRITDINGLETYVIAGGNFSNGESPAPGEYTVYTLQFLNKYSEEFKLRKIAALGPSSISANGIISSDEYPGVVFIADSFTGLIGRLDVSTGRFQQGVWSYKELKAPPGLRTGVNGVKLYQSHLYWTNSELVAVYKVPITASGWPVPDAVPQLVANLSSVASIVDDFVIDSRGNIYSATNLDNTIIFSDVKTGRSKVVAGGLKDFILEGVGALAIGRERHGEILLYGATSGGLERPINGITEGAKVSAISLRTNP